MVTVPWCTQYMDSCLSYIEHTGWCRDPLNHRLNGPAILQPKLKATWYRHSYINLNRIYILIKRDFTLLGKSAHRGVIICVRVLLMGIRCWRVLRGVACNGVHNIRPKTDSYICDFHEVMANNAAAMMATSDDTIRGNGFLPLKLPTLKIIHVLSQSSKIIQRPSQYLVYHGNCIISRGGLAKFISNFPKFLKSHLRWFVRNFPKFRNSDLFR